MADQKTFCPRQVVEAGGNRWDWALLLAASLVFSVVFAVLATKYRVVEKFLVPMPDILQLIPILGFLSITVTGFIALFPGQPVWRGTRRWRPP